MTITPEGTSKRGITLCDLQDYLTAVALKLGVVVYTNAHASWTAESLQRGIIKGSYRKSGKSVTEARQEGITKRHYDSKLLLPSDEEVELCFDLVVDATGSASTLRADLLGHHRVGRLKDIARLALQHDARLGTYFDPQRDDHVNSRIGSVNWDSFVKRVLDGSARDTVYNLVCNMPVSIFCDPENAPSIALANIRGRAGCEPFPDWFYYLFPKYSEFSSANHSIIGGGAENDVELRVDKPFRVHFEGPFPHEWKGVDVAKQLATKWTPPQMARDLLDLIGPPVSGQISSEGWRAFVDQECSFANPAQNTISAFMCEFFGVITQPAAERATLHGVIPGSEDHIQYYILGDAIQTPWYRFGIGLFDGFHSVSVFRLCLEAEKSKVDSHSLILALEQRMRIRAVQVLMSLDLHLDMLTQDEAFATFLDRVI